MAELGLARNVIALDVRLLNLLRLAGVRVSSKTQNHEATYRQLQDALLEQVARPAGVNGVQLDRIPHTVCSTSVPGVRSDVISFAESLR